LLCILYAGWVEAHHAWEIGERTGLRVASVTVPMALLKGVIPVTAALLLLQGVSELVRCARTLRAEAR
jgi:TRAP-type mannitol/chloroaromatic compound transport system permease small subunit